MGWTAFCDYARMRTSPAVRFLAAVKPRWLLLGLILLTVLLVAGDLASRHTDLALFSGDSRWHR